MKLDPNKRESVVEKCKGCRRAETVTIEGNEKEVCKLYLYPKSKWRDGVRAGVDNKELIGDTPEGKKRVGQQKQRKNKI